MGPRRSTTSTQTGNSHRPVQLGRLAAVTTASTRPIRSGARYGHVARRSHPDRIRHPARLQPRRLPATTTETSARLLYIERTFIQFAGFTFGKSQSYFDFFGGAICYGCGYGGHLVADRRRRHAASRLHGHVRQRLHRDPRRSKTPRCVATRSGMPARRDQRARRSAPARAGARSRTPGTVGGVNIGDYAAHSGARHRRCRSVSTRPGVRRRSPAPCTRFARATTATTRPARLANGPGGYTGLAPARHVRLRRRWPASCSTCRGRRVTSSGSKARTRTVPRPIPAWTAAQRPVHARSTASTAATSLRLGARCGLRQRHRHRRLAPVARRQRSSADHGRGRSRAAIEHYWTPALRTSVFGSLQRDRLQRQRDEHLLLVAAGSGPHCAGATPNFATGRGSRLQPRLQRLGRRHADDLEPGAEPRCRPRSHVHQARAEA